MPYNRIPTTNDNLQRTRSRNEKNRSKNLAHIGSDFTPLLSLTLSGLSLADKGLADGQESQRRERRVQEALLVRPRVPWHSLLLWGEPREKPVCH